MPRAIDIIVTGATGRQGGAVARALIRNGHHVRALTRNPEGSAAEALAAEGAEVVPGNFELPETVERAARGCDAMFLMTPWEKGADWETRQAIAACEAAQRGGVAHLVYSSSAGAGRRAGILHFESKATVERRLQSLGVPFTVLAPVFFMENYLSPGLAPVGGKLSMALPARRRLQVVALADLATLVRLVLERRSEFQGKRIAVASDEVSGSDAARIIGRASGTEIRYRQLPLEKLHQRSPELARMFEWYDEVGYGVDIPALHREHPEVGWHDLAAWARAQDWGFLRPAEEKSETAGS